MGEEVVVKETLTPEMIEAGRELTMRLEAAGMSFNGSLWFYSPESNTWRLLIASPEAQTPGPKAAYERVMTALGSIPSDKPRLELRDVAVVERDHPLIGLLRTAIRTGQGITGIRFSKNMINGHFISDAYIYRLN